jgi:hypothetical protein
MTYIWDRTEIRLMPESLGNNSPKRRAMKCMMNRIHHHG